MNHRDFVQAVTAAPAVTLAQQSASKAMSSADLLKGAPPTNLYRFLGGKQGAWAVTGMKAYRGSSLEAVERIEVVHGDLEHSTRSEVDPARGHQQRALCHRYGIGRIEGPPTGFGSAASHLRGAYPDQEVGRMVEPGTGSETGDLRRNFTPYIYWPARVSLADSSDGNATTQRSPNQPPLPGNSTRTSLHAGHKT